MIDFGLRDVIPSDPPMRERLPKMSYEKLLVTEQGAEARAWLREHPAGTAGTPNQRITHLRSVYSRKPREPLPLRSCLSIARSTANFGYPQGAIALPFVCAREWDAFEESAAYFAADKPQGDPLAYQYVQREAKCSFQSFKIFDGRVLQVADPAVDDADRLRNLYTAFIAVFLRHFCGRTSRNGSSTSAPLGRQKPALCANEMAAQTLLSHSNSGYPTHLVQRAMPSHSPHPWVIRAPSNSSSIWESDWRLLNYKGSCALNTAGSWEGFQWRRCPQELGSQLWMITELWQQFAMPYNLDYVKLLILHVSSHSNLVMGT
ncbi:hypothetical protein CALVIDRAFT_532040 [Calocera viscosa TUFC12733]|uniref:Uncharacterized protein n=1 Tax=Calocera viscosa (strain TUFC12733) TaxID=1330018 RepID=A0A167FI70_CALVF|nr:hypothetical protein CALVIDRAFT_532040 [Calocera viscosa TUFC12733]